MEEATLRAKIQAMKNLLEANSQTQVPRATHYYRYRSSRGRFNTVAGPVNRSWNRYSSPDAATKRSDVVERSINKVWRRKDYTDPSLASAKNKPCKRPVKMTASKCNSIQVQVPKDGEYAMVNGGFGLVRAVVKKPTMTRRSQAPVDAKPILTQTHSKNGGEMYIVANGGKLLKRCSKDERKANIAHRRGMMGTSIINGAARAALVRAKATIERARSERVLKKRIGAVRTVYCSLYNRFGKSCFSAH
ncbi:uncharacterized protein CCR75_005251 [Bremia lactucae]|uniref:Uncharacterized protein n=1 Tax=Bremia lactucae TaxID=4779 RepID=A0A976IJR3_BRELC|nr:hypothetical protein CCR75_005251 [Bremia lactucae]